MESITITNFGNIIGPKTFTFESDAKLIFITGPSGIGKTTILNAISFVFHSENAVGNLDSKMKTKETIVELKMRNGKIFKRMTNPIRFYINGKEYNKNESKEIMETSFDKEMWTNIHYHGGRELTHVLLEGTQKKKTSFLYRLLSCNELEQLFEIACLELTDAKKKLDAWKLMHSIYEKQKKEAVIPSIDIEESIDSLNSKRDTLNKLYHHQQTLKKMDDNNIFENIDKQEVEKLKELMDTIPFNDLVVDLSVCLPENIHDKCWRTAREYEYYKSQLLKCGLSESDKTDELLSMQRIIKHYPKLPDMIKKYQLFQSFIEKNGPVLDIEASIAQNNALSEKKKILNEIYNNDMNEAQKMMVLSGRIKEYKKWQLLYKKHKNTNIEEIEAKLEAGPEKIGECPYPDCRKMIRVMTTGEFVATTYHAQPEQQNYKKLKMDADEYRWMKNSSFEFIQNKLLEKDEADIEKILINHSRILSCSDDKPTWSNNELEIALAVRSLPEEIIQIALSSEKQETMKRLSTIYAPIPSFVRKPDWNVRQLTLVEIRKVQEFLKNVPTNYFWKKLTDIAQQGDLKKIYQEITMILTRWEQYIQLKTNDRIVEEHELADIDEKIKHAKLRDEYIKCCNAEKVSGQEGSLLEEDYLVKKKYVEIAHDTESSLIQKALKCINELLPRICQYVFDADKFITITVKTEQEKPGSKERYKTHIEARKGDIVYPNLSYLSDGERHRVVLALSIACALHLKVDFIMYDELFCRLNDESRENCLDALKKFVCDISNLQILYIGHHESDGARFDQVIRPHVS